MDVSKLTDEEQEALDSIKRAFYGISDEEAMDMLEVAIELVKVGEISRISGSEMVKSLKRVLENI